MTRSVSDFADFYSDELDSFKARGGDGDFLAYVVRETLALPDDEKAADKLYAETLSIPLRKFRAAQRRSRKLLDDMKLLNGEFSTRLPIFPKAWLATMTEIDEQAASWRENLRAKNSSGRQVTLVRRHFFVSALMPYIKWKPVGFRKLDRSKIRIRLWEWLNGWADWIDVVEVRDRKAFLKNPHRRLRPSDISDGILSINTRMPRSEDAAPSIRSWWQQSSTTAFHTVLAGSEAYLRWAGKKTSSKEEMRYAEAVLESLEGRGISEAQIAGYPIGLVGAILRTAPRHKKLRQFMQRQLPRLSAHAHKRTA